MIKQEIEYEGVPVGIVVPDCGRLKFVAVKFHVHALDGQRFSSVADVLVAIDRSVSRSNTARSSMQAS